MTDTSRTAEGRRLDEYSRRAENWKRWGPYLSERQWGTVRKDYSGDGGAWEHFPHDQGYGPKPRMSAEGGLVVAEHASLGRYLRGADAVGVGVGRAGLLGR